jgi:hypothetical protein
MPHSRIELRFPTAAAVDRLTADLRLPPGGQDWEIEVADAARVGEFLDAYEAGGLDDDERFALMALVVASYDELLQACGDADRQVWARLRGHLLGEFGLHAYTVQHWSLPDHDDDPDHVFLFTALAREVMAAVYGPREQWPREPFVVRRFNSLSETMDICDERDGTFALGWSTSPNRPHGQRRGFPSVADAVAFAAREFGVPPERWKHVQARDSTTRTPRRAARHDGGRRRMRKRAGCAIPGRLTEGVSVVPGVTPGGTASQALKSSGTVRVPLQRVQPAGGRPWGAQAGHQRSTVIGMQIMPPWAASSCRRVRVTAPSSSYSAAPEASRVVRLRQKRESMAAGADGRAGAGGGGGAGDVAGVLPRRRRS